MSKPESRAYRVYIVEAILAVDPNWPRWSRVNASAFTDARNPGPKSFFNSIGYNCDVTQVRSRITFRTHPHLREFADEFAFTVEADAVACAERLREFGRWRSGWEGPEAWRVREREEVPQVRVVEINLVETREVIATFADTPKVVAEAGKAVA